MNSIEKFAQKIEVEFNDIGLLEKALTHRSYINENTQYKLGHNERLEFLGDAVLELVVTDYLHGNYTNSEGELTAWRAALVNTDMLARVSNELDIELILRMSKGESRDKGSRARHHLLANAVEAVIGAIYLDNGYDKAKDFINRYIIVNFDEILDKKMWRDDKSYFQERAQKNQSMTPHYSVISETGPDHGKVFEVGVYLGEELIATGTGESKQQAQRAAASAALIKKGW
jgi:ribonuclease-3